MDDDLRRGPAPVRHRLPVLLAMWAGMIGFVGLLVASTLMPSWALALRIGAGVWLLAFGVLKLGLELGPKPRR